MRATGTLGAIGSWRAAWAAVFVAVLGAVSVAAGGALPQKAETPPTPVNHDPETAYDCRQYLSVSNERPRVGETITVTWEAPGPCHFAYFSLEAVTAAGFEIPTDITAQPLQLTAMEPGVRTITVTWYGEMHSGSAWNWHYLYGSTTLEVLPADDTARREPAADVAPDPIWRAAALYEIDQAEDSAVWMFHRRYRQLVPADCVSTLVTQGAVLHPTTLDVVLDHHPANTTWDCQLIASALGV